MNEEVEVKIREIRDSIRRLRLHLKLISGNLDDLEKLLKEASE